MADLSGFIVDEGSDREDDRGQDSSFSDEDSCDFTSGGDLSSGSAYGFLGGHGGECDAPASGTSDSEDYMADVWGSDTELEWLPRGQRPPRSERHRHRWARAASTVGDRRQQLRRRRQRRGVPIGSANLDALEEGENYDEEHLDGEEDVDREDRSVTYTYCPLDLDSFNGRALPPEIIEPQTRAEPVIYEDRYQGAWGSDAARPTQGHIGFNKFATAKMKAANVGSAVPSDGKDDVACPPLQPQQQVVEFLLHPESPIKHLLVDHPTGSGKTREMIRVLDGLFLDPRPKVPIFPKQPVCRNFYVELLRWPSRYRDYYCCICPGGAYLAAGNLPWRERRKELWNIGVLPEVQVRELARSCREALEMKGAYFEGQLRPYCREAFHAQHPGEHFPAAPLRALTYASAGGFNTKFDGIGRPVSSFFKVGHRGAFANVYDFKIVLMDEAHNLVLTETQYVSQLTTLRTLLSTAQDTILVGFTGTPILNEPAEGRVLLDIIKGQVAVASKLNDEGFLSSLAAKPRPLFPRCLPSGVPEVALSNDVLRRLCRKVVLRGDALRSYIIKSQTQAILDRRLRAYCNMYAYAGSYHEGANGCKWNLLQHPENLAPKLQVIAETVARKCQKSLILIARGSGYRAMLDIMRQVAERASPSFNVASIDQLAEFNSPSNLQGQRFLCFVADAAQCSEGVSFYAVRYLHLVDVPTSPTVFVQQCGRANRMFGHIGLQPKDQTVATRLHVAVLPAWARTPLGAWLLRSFCAKTVSGEVMENRCRKSLSQLRKAGIRTLDQLKTKLDTWGSSAARRKRSNGSLPESSSTNSNGKMRLANLEHRDIRALMNELGLAEEAAHLEHVEHLESRKSEEDPAVRRQVKQSQRAHALRVALQELYVTDRTEMSARFPTETADEISLRALAIKSEKCAKALEGLRSQAVDKQVLAHLGKVPKGEGKDPPSSGEDVEVDLLARSGSKRPKSANRAAKKRFLQAKANSIDLPDAAVEGTSFQYLSVPKFQRSQSFPDASMQEQLAIHGELGPRQKRLRFKQPAPSIFERSFAHETPGIAQDAPIESSPRLSPLASKHQIKSNVTSDDATMEYDMSLLRNWSVKALKDELRKRQPDIDLDHIYLHEELCQLLTELRERDKQNIPATKTLLDRQVDDKSETQSACNASDLGPDRRKSSLQDLRQMPVSVLKDFLARVRPDLDQRTLLEKEELCNALIPYL